MDKDKTRRLELLKLLSEITNSAPSNMCQIELIAYEKIIDTSFLILQQELRILTMDQNTLKFFLFSLQKAYEEISAKKLETENILRTRTFNYTNL